MLSSQLLYMNRRDSVGGFAEVGLKELDKQQHQLCCYQTMRRISARLLAIREPLLESQTS